MPRDDYQRANRRDIARLAKSQKDYESRKRQRQRTLTSTERLIDFPPHVLREQPDGTYLSDPMVFTVTRWPHLRNSIQRK